jgi:hypothetical protein
MGPGHGFLSAPRGYSRPCDRAFLRCYPQAPAPLPEPAAVAPPYGGAPAFCTACHPARLFRPCGVDDIEDHHTQDLGVAFHCAPFDTQFLTAVWPGTPSNDSTSTVFVPAVPSLLRGRLFQLEPGREAASRSAPIVANRADRIAAATPCSPQHPSPAWSRLWAGVCGYRQHPPSPFLGG